MKIVVQQFSLTLAVLFVFFVNGSFGQDLGNVKAIKIFDYVLELDTYTTLDYNYASEKIAQKFGNWGGMCSAIATVTNSGDVLVGRNMDLYISHKPAYVVRTNVKGNYQTVGLSYFHQFSPDYVDALEHGVPQDYSRCLPFLCTDVLNSEGLYVETNMRNGESNEDGSSKFGCSGTNPNSKERVCSLALPRYICEKCATVEEAVAFVKSLDVYTPSSEPTWNFCFVMADATGHYGLLEIAKNKVSWLEGQRAQTNFYVTEEFAKDEQLKCGLGRYETIMKKIGGVQNENDMYELMKEVSYFQVFLPGKCRFDLRSEFVGVEDCWTIDYVLDEANRKEVLDQAVSSSAENLTDKELRDQCSFWNSAFTEIINCKKKTLFVRFFENDDQTLTLSFK